MEASYRRAREKYRPETTDILWVAESPPVGGGYFYFEKASGGNHLFRETMRALGWWPMDEPMHTGFDKSSLLRKFQGAGHYLIDLSPTPVDGLPPKERRIALRKSVPHMMDELTAINPNGVLIIKRNVFRILYPNLKSSEFKVLNSEPIPFPSNHWQAVYRERIRGLIRGKGKSGPAAG